MKKWGLDEFKKSCLDCEKSLNRKKKNLEAERRSKISVEFSLISKLNNSRIQFFPVDQSKTASRLRKYIKKEIWERPVFRMICFAFWSTRLEVNHLRRFKEEILRFIKNIQIANDFPLHEAVFSHDLYRIHKICVGEDLKHFYININQPDHLGNTPLMLAVKLKQQETALVLIDHGADPKYSALDLKICPIDQALAELDKAMLRVLLRGHLRQLREKWFSHNKDFLDALSQVKDFSLTMSWQCKSNLIPFLEKFTPSDVYKIYKRGKDLRVDLTLVARENFKDKRGKLSVFYDGYTKKIQIFDHVLNTLKDFSSEPSDESVENALDNLLKTRKTSNEVLVDEIILTPELNWKGEKKTELIQNWKSTKHKLACVLDIKDQKKEAASDTNLAKFRTFEEYLAYSPEETSKTKNFEKQKNEKKKQLSVNLWLCEDFPLNFQDFLPFIELLSSFSKNAQDFSRIFCSTNLLGHGFPVKASIPVYASVKLIVHIESISMEAPDSSFFLIPDIEAASEESTLKLDEWTSKFFRQCEVSEDDNLLEAQKIFQSLQSLEPSPLLQHISEQSEELEDMPETSTEVHNTLPKPHFYNKNALSSTIFKKQEFFKKVKTFVMMPKYSKNDADIFL